MSTLQVHITAGPQAGARLQINQSPATFGRAGDNTIVLDLPVVSRLHGELAIDESGEWVLINHSQNGTRLGRKKITKKPLALTDGAPVTIGDTEVFRVYLPKPAADPAALDDAPHTDDSADEQPAGHAPGAGLKGKSKLWIGIGAWIAFLVLISVYFLTAQDGNDQVARDNGLYFPGAEIEDMEGPEAGRTAIKRLLDEPLPPNDPNASRYDEHIVKARQAVNGGTGTLYDAYRHYQQAMSYSSDRSNPLEPIDKVRYDNVVEELAAIIYERYIYAYRLNDRGSYQQASEMLDRLRREFYHSPEPGDPLAGHIRRLRNAAHNRSGN